MINFKNFSYFYRSHNFNPGVVIAYSNLFKYPFYLTEDFLFVEMRMQNRLFLFNKDFDFSSYITDSKKTVIYCENRLDKLKKINKEVVYDLEKIFSLNDKNIRRGKNIVKRAEVKIRTSSKSKEDYNIIQEIFSEWVSKKNADVKVFKMTFSPMRYYRTYILKEKIPNIYEKIIYVRNISYAVINFHLNGDTAYELSFCSKFYDKELNFLNDLNESLFVGILYDLYLNFGIKKVNVGTEAGIKGLRIFKRKLPFDYNIYYSN